MTYDEMVELASSKNIEVVELPFRGCGKGYHVEDVIFINCNLTSVDKRCTLAEELCHVEASCGNILDLNDIQCKQQENYARKLGCQKLIGILDLIDAFKKGINTRYELAEYLNVTEEFLDASVNAYKKKYGTHFNIDNYIIRFEPTLGIFEMR